MSPFQETDRVTLNSDLVVSTPVNFPYYKSKPKTLLREYDYYKLVDGSLYQQGYWERPTAYKLKVLPSLDDGGDGLNPVSLYGSRNPEATNGMDATYKCVPLENYSECLIYCEGVEPYYDSDHTSVILKIVIGISITESPQAVVNLRDAKMAAIRVSYYNMDNKELALNGLLGLGVRYQEYSDAMLIRRPIPIAGKYGRVCFSFQYNDPNLLKSVGKITELGLFLR